MNHPAIARRSLLTAAGCALLRPAAASSGHERLQNKTYAADIIVIGFGAAGASAAIEAARAGSSVLILENHPKSLTVPLPECPRAFTFVPTEASMKKSLLNI